DHRLRPQDGGPLPGRGNPRYRWGIGRPEWRNPRRRGGGAGPRGKAMIPAASERIRVKAATYLTVGRVTVTQADDTSGIFGAAVHGSGTYTVFRGGDADPWHCNCPAGLFGRPCAHAHAAALVAG